jgi:hypothetical protein
MRRLPMTDYSTYREKVRLPRPPFFFQGDGAKCWAYALASWLQVRTGDYFDPEALAQKWNEKGPLDFYNAETVLRGEGARYVHSVSKSEFTAAYIISLLEGTYVYLTYNRPGSSFSHCVVIYGVHGGSKARVAIMDPQKGYKSLPLPVDLDAPPIEKLLIAY